MIDFDLEFTWPEKDQEEPIPSAAETVLAITEPNNLTDLDMVLGFFENRKDNARAELRGDSAPPVEESAIALENAQVVISVLHNLDTHREITDSTCIAALWELHVNKGYALFSTEKTSFNKLSEFIFHMRHTFYNGDFLVRLSRGAEKILEYVNQRHLSGDPIIDENGETITVDTFIERRGYASKISQFQKQFDDLPDVSEDGGVTKDEFVKAIASKPRSEVSHMLKASTTEESVRLRCVEELREDEDGNVRYILTFDLSETEFKLLSRLTKDWLEVN